MKVLVIGGTSFIGRRLVAELLKAGHDVTVLHRRAKHDLGRRVHNLQGDRNDPETVRRLLSRAGFEVVFDNAYDWERGTGPAHVEAAALATSGDRLHRYVFLSSVAAYGDGLNHHEGDALAADDDPNPYGRNKAMTERMLFRLHQKSGFPVVTFRPPYVFGPGNPFYREAFFWDRLRDGRPIVLPGDGHRLMQFVYVRDLVGSMLRSIEVADAAGEAFNIGYDRPLTQLEVVQSLAAAANKKPSIVRVPRERIVEAGGNPLGQPAYFGFYYDMPAITEVVAKVKRILKFEATPFDKALKETYRAWLKEKRTRIDYSFEDKLIAMATLNAAD
jgi:nucleoside-diphosphate-sugar epimerase